MLRWTSDCLKFSLKETDCGGVDWIYLGQCSYEWRSVVNVEMKMPVIFGLVDRVLGFQGLFHGGTLSFQFHTFIGPCRCSEFQFPSPSAALVRTLQSCLQLTELPLRVEKSYFRGCSDIISETIWWVGYAARTRETKSWIEKFGLEVLERKYFFGRTRFRRRQWPLLLLLVFENCLKRQLVTLQWQCFVSMVTFRNSKLQYVTRITQQF